MIANILITVGLVMTVAGLYGVFWCIQLARKVKAGEVPEDKLSDALTRMSAVNMAAMGGAMLGLSVLLVGLILD